jgi:hypothetical protein
MAIFNQMEGAFRKQMKSTFRRNKYSNITNTQREKINNIIINSMRYFYYITIEKLTPILSENFTVEEFKELNAFLESPLGRKNVELGPKLMAKLIPILTLETGKMQQQMMLQIKEVLEEKQ